MDVWNWVDFDGPRGNVENQSGLAAGEVSAHEARALEDAYQNGFAEGVDSAQSAARSELRDAVQAALRVAQEVQENREAWHARLVENLAVIAAGIAGSVIGRAHEEDPTLFRELAEKAVSEFPADEALRIRLNPHDRAALNDGDELDGVLAQRAIRWIPDEDIVRGGCVVEGPDRIVDARVDEALVRVIGALTND